MIESDLRRNHPLKGHMDKWIGNGKPEEQQEELIGKRLGIIPKEPQWRPADPDEWPRQLHGKFVPFEPKVNAPNTLDEPQFEEGNWPGYLGHADDFRP